MKKLLFLALWLPTATIAQVKYDAELAKSVGGDENGMKQYVMVILKTGKNTTASASEKQELFAGHMSNIQKLAGEGKLAVAGPFGKNELAYRGIFILDCTTPEEAEALTNTDPAVKAGIFECEYLPWYGTAALMATPKLHEKIIKPKE